ncbi:MAG: FAD-dependent oxidoreductase [Candidatus Bathyarchaeota archaeon]|nr:FAD-dependent oxidoreductase [Candidatus Bathyarchaeota archaeon]
MVAVKLHINDVEVEVAQGTSILEAARKNDIYIPSLCYHPDLPPSRRLKATDTVYRGNEKIVGDEPQKEFEGCNLCLIEVEGEQDLVPACDTVVAEGMRVFADNRRVLEARREKLMDILAKHPHACLVCAQKEGCTREPCSTNVPVAERCCPKFGNCELQKVAEYIGVREDTPRYIPADLPVVEDEPLFVRDINLCVGCTRCVRTCQELRGVEALGFVYKNGEALVGTVGPNLKDSACKFCGACVEVCPTGALMEKEPIVGEREIVLVPCKHACFADVDVPRYVHLISEGLNAEAAAVIREKAPLPSVLAHACARPCENKCRSREVNEPIAICALKRFVMDQDAEDWKSKLKIAPSTGKRVGIVGSGAAGLTSAYYLTLLGYSVTIFESMPEPGGMMRYGIQEYRLPREVLQKDLRLIVELGVEIKTNVAVGDESSFEQLKESYDAILVATGLPSSRKLKVEGAELEGVLGGLNFLRDVRLGKDVTVGEKVLVLGGGNVAMDVALTALRSDAKHVQVACLETWEEMPAFPWERQQVIEEDITVNNSWGLKRILGRDGKVSSVELLRCISVFDKEGRFNPAYDESETKMIEADTFIFAIGQASDRSWLDANSLTASLIGTIKVDNSTMKTALSGIFACGDIVDGPTSIVEAIASGRKAAIAIDKYLGGSGQLATELVSPEEPNPWLGREEGFAYRRRVEMPTLPVEERRGNFVEVELGLNQKLAIEEAKRCLRCDLRLQIASPVLPPEKWLKLETATIAGIRETEGIYQLLDENKMVIYIKGTINLRKELEEQLTTNPKAKYLIFEEAKMFTMRESELLQQFLKKHGKLPEQNLGLEEDLY